VDGSGLAVETPIGYLPAKDGLDLSGLAIDPKDLDLLLRVDIEGWKKEADDIGDYYRQFGDRIPRVLLHELTRLRQRLTAAETVS
ncbi:MAG: phosphoenolpyruvate carboxykinase domain-containing protein, partial [Candidatus Omnitrophica bacterium]|nr:phosphoenolpyruvate carboxykinase domain-containing protein [Candidatus Omnitrophota bacterium]